MSDKQKVLEKWTGVMKGKYDKGTLDCAYCRKYSRWDCLDLCPVKKVTGRDCCEGTPYQRWMTHSAENTKGRRLPSRLRFIKRRKALEAAKDMYKFLETLPED